jgi:hypothetical protein
MPLQAEEEKSISFDPQGYWHDTILRRFILAWISRGEICLWLLPPSKGNVEIGGQKSM